MHSNFEKSPYLVASYHSPSTKIRSCHVTPDRSLGLRPAPPRSAVRATLYSAQLLAGDPECRGNGWGWSPEDMDRYIRYG